MAYVLIPDGFALKKVTKAQQDAVDEYFGRERRGSYFNTLIDNPTTATLAVSVLTGSVLAAIIQNLFGEGGPFTAEQIAEKLNPTDILKEYTRAGNVTRTFESAFDLLDVALQEQVAKQ